MKRPSDEMAERSDVRPEVSTMVAVGTVTFASVRLWARLERPSDLALRLEGPEGKRAVSLRPSWGEQNTCAFTYPNDFPGEAPLCAGTRYRLRGGTPLDRAHGRRGPRRVPSQVPFTRRTCPAGSACTPALSCHQPFGTPTPPSSAQERVGVYR
ncbi:MAG: hypothetical protein KA712_15980 [Myxococcales bacterium]|nr:hypothetical protein [Myxococcales bacterium]